MLPGEDWYNETGADLSYMLPMPGSWASVVSADVLNGSSWHPDEARYDSAWAGRWTNSFLIKDTPLDIGFSATQGTNNVMWDRKTEVYGFDVKTKIPLDCVRRLTLQGEYFYNDSEVIVSTVTGSFDRAGRQGFYAFFNLQLSQRWNAGVIYDQYNPADNKDLTNSTIKGFLGFSFLEESTLLRLAYEQFMPQGSPVVNTVTLQLMFSMGPHKAHQF
jgi:hypothetical protein